VNCSWCEERFERFLDGDLAAHERAHVRRHVDACAGCRAMLEELRVVDALLLGPRSVALAPNFTFATMAEIRAIVPPHPRRTPLAAYLVCYLTASWLLVAAAYVLAPPWMPGVRETILGLGATLVDALRGIAQVVSRLAGRGDVGAMTSIVGAVLLIDVLLLVAIAGFARFAPARIGNARW
jgi:hypothetical protein